MVATIPTTPRSLPRPSDVLADLEFLVPALPPVFVDRERLRPLVQRAAKAALTIVAAPPGAGKTTIFAHITRTSPAGAVAWCTLGPGHNDAHGFACAVLRAVLGARRAGGGVDLAMMRAASPDPLDQAVQLVAHGPHLELVLDNADSLRSAEAGAALQRLVHLAPPELSLVLLTHQDPDLRVDRLPAGEVVRIRAADLAFTENEVAALFQNLGNALGEIDLGTVTRWTGGLAASVALAAVVTRDPEARARLLAEARDGDRAVCDYLTFEVLALMPRELRDFALRTSIVEVMNREFASSIANIDDAGPRLEALAREQFLTTLDGWPGWYRYHDMFVQMLRAAFLHDKPGHVDGAHRRAAEWLLAEGLPQHAITHAAAAQDWDTVAAIVIDQWIDAALAGAPSRVSSYAALIPTEPRVADAACALASALWEYAEQHDAQALVDVARAEHLDTPGRACVRFPAALLKVVLHMECTPAGPDIDEVGDELMRWALAPTVTRERADAIATVVLLARSKARFREGDLVAQGDLLEHAIEAATESGLDVMAASATARLALVTALRGRIRSAVALNEELGELWATTDAPLPRALRSLTLALCAYHRDDLPLARGALAEARAHLRPGATRDVVANIVAARLRLSDGDIRTSRRLLANAAAAGCPGLFDATCDALGIPSPEAHSGRATLHSYAIVQHLVETAVRSFEAGNAADALEQTQRALAIVDRHGYRRAFIDSEFAVQPLLAEYVAHVRPFRMIATQLLERMHADGEQPASRYVERLTERELTVLRLLPTMMSNSEIAADLFFSVNTVKTHLKSIYRKLEVGRRRDAVQRARELSLI